MSKAQTLRVRTNLTHQLAIVDELIVAQKALIGPTASRIVFEDLDALYGERRDLRGALGV